MLKYLNIALFIMLLILIGLGILNFSRDRAKNEASGNLEQLIKKYPHLSKRVLIDSPNDSLINFISLRSQLRQFIAPFRDNFALYFEYLPTGVSIGINERDRFNPASLGKLPLAMAYFIGERKGSVDLNKKVKIEERHLDDRSGSLYKRGAGIEISLDEAINLALTESDNTAANVLAENVSAEDFRKVFDDLDVPFPVDDNNVITVRGYASILKALYFSAVLDRDDSEKLLELLTKTKFKDELPAGVPTNIPVAHKIGFIDAEHHMDCGIVYLPKRQYILCMVSKSSLDEARIRMKTVSEMVYKYISSQE